MKIQLIFFKAYFYFLVDDLVGTYITEYKKIFTIYTNFQFQLNSYKNINF